MDWFFKYLDQEDHKNYKTPFVKEFKLLYDHILIATWTWHTQYFYVVDIYWLDQLFVTQLMRLKDEGCAIILTEIAEVKEEIGEVKEALHKLGRNLGVCLFHVPKVPSTHPLSNVTPLDIFTATTKGEACKL